MPIFGYDAPGGTAYRIDDRIRGTSYLCTEEGIAQSISVNLSIWGAGEKVKCALYRKSDNVLIGVTEERSSGGTGYQVFNFSDPKPSLVATDYILAVIGDSSVTRMQCTETSVYRYYKTELYVDGFPNPFDGTIGTANYKYHIYCTYETVSAPTVTTQAVTDIQPTTATGHGNITNTGGENCTKRGVCWNTGGNPTVADSKSEETGSFGTGAFTRPMTGLTPGQHYYVKAYAYNSAGYGYGSQVEFTASKLLQPTGIASAEAFGALTVVPGAVSVLPTAIGSLEAFGSAKLNLKLILTGIASAEAFGTPSLGNFLLPSSIASEEAFGNLVIAGPLIVPGIASQEAVGSPKLNLWLQPTGISSEELFGLPKLNVFVTPSGIVTSEALGTAKLNLKLILSGIASAEAFGTPTVEMILVIRPSGIASVELFGTPLLIVILAGGDGMKLPTTKGQISIPSKEVSI